MDEAKRKQFIARLSRALGRDQEMCPHLQRTLITAMVLKKLCSKI